MGYDAAQQQVVLFGRSGSGTYRGHGKALSDTWIWDGRNWTHQSATGPVVSQGLVSMAYDAGHQQLLLVDDAGQTWTWAGNNWRQLHPVNSPPSGNPGAMAYDAGYQQVVLLDTDGNTWTWDGGGWTRQPAVPPYGGGIAGTALAYDAAAGQMLLVSGTGRYLHMGWAHVDAPEPGTPAIVIDRRGAHGVR